MRRLAQHFVEKADGSRVDRLWDHLDARFERSRRRRPLRLGAAALALVAVVAFVFYAGVDLRRATPGEQVLELADGSRVEHSSADRIEVAEVTPTRVDLRLRQGRAHFRVTPNRDRTFLTRAAGYTIVVVGTEFTVELGSGAVRVAVSRGEVEVRRDDGGDVWRVRTGESWSSTAGPPTLPSVDAVAPAPVPRGAADADVQTPPPSLEASASPAVSAAPKRALPTAAPGDEAAALFQRAQEARLAGRPDEAARLLGELLQRFPADPRAGLAAFELGRLRLDSGDARGAVEALDHAEGAGNSFEEQVQARRVQALEQSGDLVSCRAARAGFLRRFPDGSFSAAVRRRCP